MTSPDDEIRNVPPVLAGAVAIMCFGLGSGLGWGAAVLADAPPWIAIPLWLAGAVGGYLVGRAILRLLYTR